MQAETHTEKILTAMLPLDTSVLDSDVSAMAEAPGPPKKRKKYTRWNIPAHALEMLEQMYWKDKFPTVET